MNDIEQDAHFLLGLFEEHSYDYDEERLVSERGLELMTTYFDNVDRDDRGFVFLEFLNLLHHNGYKYEMDQFMDMDETDEMIEVVQ